MKAIKYVLFLALMFAPLAAQAALDILACEPEWAALADEIGGDKVKTSSATHALQDPHYIQARPSLIANLVAATGRNVDRGQQTVALFDQRRQLDELLLVVEQRAVGALQLLLQPDALLAQGLLPPDILKEAVMDTFVPSQLAASDAG